MIRRKKPIILLIIIMIVSIIILSVGYAALSTTLNITSNSITQNPMTWNIGFQTGSITGVASTNSGTISCGSATVTSTTITGVSPVFDTADGRCSYTFKIKNSGTIGGKISSINITKPLSSCTTSGSTMTCGNMVYKLHYNSATSTSLVAVNDTINAMSGSTPTEKTVVLTIEHSGIETNGYNQSGFAYQITFIQN